MIAIGWATALTRIPAQKVTIHAADGGSIRKDESYTTAGRDLDNC
jgi:hypothetical protein